MELEAQRKDEERQEEEVTEELESHDAGNGKGVFFIWGGNVSFWDRWPECRMVHEACSNPVLPGHMMRKQELLHRHHWITFLKGR